MIMFSAFRYVYRNCSSHRNEEIKTEKYGIEEENE